MYMYISTKTRNSHPIPFVVYERTPPAAEKVEKELGSEN
jgi:hypothetical protein